MRYGSVCSGIEAASVAWEPLGFAPQWFSEINPFACAVLAERWPSVPNLGDMTAIRNAPAIDLLVGGTPCQSFSVAGLRGGLDDDRGNLALVFARLARDLRPRWVVWENVPGVLSSNGGRDFGSILGALVELGYGLAYRVLDAQFFGVPQRRRRVFVVGHLGDWRRAAAVLFERESLQRNPPPRRAQGEEVAGTLGGGSGSRGWAPDTDRMTFVPAWPAEVAPTLDAHYGEKQGIDRQHIECQGAALYVPGAPIAFDPTQITSPTNRSQPRPGAPAPTLARGARPPAIAFNSKAHGGDAGLTSPTLRAGGHAKSRANAGAPPAIASHHTQDPISGPVSPALGATTDGMGVCVTGGVTHTLRAEGFDASEDGTGRGQPIVPSNMRVRRLTPRECERLQGFPDDYTLIDWSMRASAAKIADDVRRYYERTGLTGDALRRAALCPDGPRYRAIGNSKAVPVVRWLGRRIQFVDQLEAA